MDRQIYALETHFVGGRVPSNMVSERTITVVGGRVGVADHVNRVRETDALSRTRRLDAGVRLQRVGGGFAQSVAGQFIVVHARDFDRAGIHRGNEHEVRGEGQRTARG